MGVGWLMVMMDGWREEVRENWDSVGRQGSSP